MPDKSRRLDILLKLREKETREAMQKLNSLHRTIQDNQKKQVQLQGYRQDYMEQLQTLGQQGGSIGRFRNRLEFINNLDTALDQLKNHIQFLDQQKTQLELNYQQTRMAEKAVNKLISREENKDFRKKEALDRKESDEYAQKQWYSRKMD